jgi:hypothetical protein
LNPLISPVSKSDSFQTMPGPRTSKGKGVVFAFADTCPS